MSSEAGAEALPAPAAPPHLTEASFPFVKGAPMVRLFLMEEGRRVLTDALVDSGAERSLFPMRIARELGIKKTLRRDPVKRQGADGRTFRVHSRVDPVQAHVVVVAGAQQQLAGPLLRLEPVFADCDHVIVGRRDFFSHFTVTFAHALEPRLVLRWSEDARS